MTSAILYNRTQIRSYVVIYTVTIEKIKIRAVSHTLTRMPPRSSFLNWLIWCIFLLLCMDKRIEYHVEDEDKRENIIEQSEPIYISVESGGGF
jgi:hypothetical protein